VGNIYFCNSNWGFLGSQIWGIYESRGGCFNPNPEQEVQAPSFETPPNSGLEYLFQGALWIGAIVTTETEIETLVTVGADGWYWIYEMAPGVGPQFGIIEKSTRSGVVCSAPDAVSEQDIIAIFSDTADAPLTQWDVTSDWDGRSHHPLGVEITQIGYSWSLPEYDDFIILYFYMKNIGTYDLSDLYLGFYMDTDICHISENPYNPEEGAQDDITGFLKNYVTPSSETTEVNIAWAADNNGQPYSGVFTEISPTGVIGFKLLGCSNPDVGISYNWWISNTQGYPKDWGPWLKVNQQKWEEINPYGSGDRFPDNAMGTPGGDRSKYFILSNGEMDFDQILTDTLPKLDTSWVPAQSSIIQDLVDGYDIRYLYSLGPFNLFPGDSIFAAIALIAGGNFHTDPENENVNLPLYPYTYYSNLDFSNLIENAQKTQQIYDTLLDFQPPASIKNLRASLIENGSVTLTWTVPGDDWDFGLASFYDLRYSDSPVEEDTISWWGMADTVLDEPIPSPAGLVDSCQISGFSVSEVYYLIIRTCDNAGNWSGFSNVGYTGTPGDVNLDNEVDIEDILLIIQYMFRRDIEPSILASADVNGDCLVNIVDVVYLINYLFKGGAAPQIGCA
jgi:hypothetical protein